MQNSQSHTCDHLDKKFSREFSVLRMRILSGSLVSAYVWALVAGSNVGTFQFQSLEAIPLVHGRPLMCEIRLTEYGSLLSRRCYSACTHHVLRGGLNTFNLDPTVNLHDPSKPVRLGIMCIVSASANEGPIIELDDVLAPVKLRQPSSSSSFFQFIVGIVYALSAVGCLATPRAWRGHV